MPVAALTKSLDGIRCWGELLLLLGFKLEIPSPSSSPSPSDEQQQQQQQPTLSFPSSDPLSQLPTAISLLAAFLGLSHHISLILLRLFETSPISSSSTFSSSSSSSFLRRCSSALNQRLGSSSSNSFQMSVSTAAWDLQPHRELLTASGFTVDGVQRLDADSNGELGTTNVRFRLTDVPANRKGLEKVGIK